jgi:hypothetical protein
VSFEYRHAILKRKYEDENRGLKTEWEEMFVPVERNQKKYFVSQTRTLLKVSCANRDTDVRGPHVARKPRCLTPVI